MLLSINKNQRRLTKEKNTENIMTPYSWFYEYFILIFSPNIPTTKISKFKILLIFLRFNLTPNEEDFIFLN